MPIFQKTLSQIIKHTSLRERVHAIKVKKSFYQSQRNDEEIVAYQLESFNRIWKKALREIPFYQMWQKEHGLPEVIRTVAELKNFPVLSKKNINENFDLITKNLNDYYLTSTGGTSGVTTHFPTSRQDALVAYVNAYLGRSWWGVSPCDPILMFWGHSHLFGKGYKRYLKEFKRKCADYLINTKRMSCYQLDTENVREFYEEILGFQPKAVISYASNVFKVCKFMEAEGLMFDEPNFVGFILTSETVTSTDEALIKKLFHTNVIHEYGMAETGAIAYSKERTDNIQTFWDSFLLTVDENKTLYLTTIHDKTFPLINYTTEDRVSVGLEVGDSVLAMQSIVGKARDILTVPLKTGKTEQISTIFFDHVLKFYPDLYSIHFKQTDDKIEILFTSAKQIDTEHLKQYMIKETEKEFQNINWNQFSLKQIDKPIKTIAGKNKSLL